MLTFTTIVENVPSFNVEAHNIYAVTAEVMNSLLGDAPRGAKCRKGYSLIDKDGGKYLVCAITVQNMRGTELGYALVISEQPEVAGQRSHANYPLSIVCQGCGGNQFYDVDRSLDYNNHICAGCGRSAKTLTETGASA